MLRKISWSGPFLLGLCMACYHNQGQSVASQPTTLQPDRSASILTPNSIPPRAPQPDRLRLTAERTHVGRSAKGTVLLRQPVTPDAGDSLHLKLAGTRAWLALGEQHVAIEDWPGAIACAQAGIAELGDEYASGHILDHTDMKLLVAKEHIKNGELKNAAANMLRQLTLRTRYYVKLHADEIAE